MGQSQPQAPRRVLIVEDDPILMMALVEFVENAGCEAVETHTIAEAIQILETRTDIRTVFTDLDMRGSTAGMALALLIRDRWPPIELLMISSQPWDTAQIPSRGIVLGKPFDRRKIEAALRRFAALAFFRRSGHRFLVENAAVSKTWSGHPVATRSGPALEHFPTKRIPVRRRQCGEIKDLKSFTIATRS